MTVNYTTNLALGQPVTGTESGTWGDDVNNAVTSYLDIAIAGGLAVTVTTADVTLTLTQGTSSATNIGSTTAQYAILNVSGAMTAARNLILPSSSRQYVINNACTGGFLLTVKGSATTGVTLVNGEKAHVFWNGTDYAKMSNASGGAGVFSSITNSGLTSGRVVYSTTGGLETDSANLTFNGTTLTANTIGAFTLSGTIAGGGNQINNVIIGTTTPLAGAFTTLAASGAVTLSGGTANGVTYLNGSKVLTSGSALVFDGTNFTVGYSSGSSRFNVSNNGVGGLEINPDGTAGGPTLLAYNRITPAYLQMTSSALRHVWQLSGTEAMRIDSSGNVLVTSAAGLGYGTGSGGTVTQATDKSTAVTLNKPTGQITTNNAALAGNTAVGFGVNNSLVTGYDTVLVTVSASGNYTATLQYVTAGSFRIVLTNATGGSLSDAVLINFSIIKGATS